MVVVVEEISRFKIEAGMIPKIEKAFDDETVEFSGSDGNFRVCTITVPKIPKSFLDKFGTGIEKLDEYLWETQVRHKIAWACGEYRFIKTPYGERRIRVWQ